MRTNSNSTAAVTEGRASITNGGMSQSMYEDSTQNIMDESQIRMTLQSN